MRLVVQRVSHASVSVDGNQIASIGRGLLALVCVEREDTEETMVWCARKTAEMRIFPDDAGLMNRDVREAGGAVLAVSQFTLAADIDKGRRPGFTNAAPPEKAQPMFEKFCEMVRGYGLEVQTGKFGATMAVEMVNDGPVTIVVEKRLG
jgi:D-aminoacyl-tRNA deacylase